MAKVIITLGHNVELWIDDYNQLCVGCFIAGSDGFWLGPATKKRLSELQEIFGRMKVFCPEE